MKTLHLDIETGDPDDLWTLALMATHPLVNLKTVSVYPGRPDQIGLVRKVLNRVGRDDVVIGADVLKDDKKSVGLFYHNWLGTIPEEDPDVDLINLRKDHIKDGTDLITGGPLKNILSLVTLQILDSSGRGRNKLFSNWTAQGGFVGCNIIADENALEKFRGKETVATYNLGGHKNSSLYLTSQEGAANFDNIRMVGKNVCHGFILNKEDIDRLPKGEHAGLDLMINGMEFYCKKKPQGKAMHDILAALCHVAPQHAKWVTGFPFRVKGTWGFKQGQSNIKALVEVDRDGILKWLV